MILKITRFIEALFQNELLYNFVAFLAKKVCLGDAVIYKQKSVNQSKSSLLLINMNFCDGLMIILLHYSELHSEVLLKFLVLIKLNE